MRFDDIIGKGHHQIPPGSTVLSAQLIVSAFDNGSLVNLHRMLVPFGKAATWDSLVAGVSADGLEVSRHKDGFTFGKIAASSSGAVFDVTDTLQIWVNGRDHWPRFFSIVMAGGGTKRGYVHGASDALAAEPADMPLGVEDYSTTLYHLLGIDANKQLLSPGDRPQAIVMNGKVVHELLA